VSGPYYDANVGTYRLVVFEAGRRKSVSSRTYEEALELKAEIERALKRPGGFAPVPVEEALTEFLEEKRKRGLKERSLHTLGYKLRYFLPVEQPLSSFTPEQAQSLYDAETERISRFGRVTRAQTHHSVLRMTKLFFRWAVEKKYLASNPFDGVKPVGKANAGKEQLRIDEARRLTQVLIAGAQQGEEGAIAAFCQLLLGLRSSEVLARKVRDLDDDGQVLWIPSGKTHNARRRLEVPDALRPFLLKLTEGKGPERLLFGGDRSEPYFHIWLWRQVKKYCQRANLPRVCPHSLRGLHSSLAVAAGCTSGAVASALGHGNFSVTAKHYVDPDTLRNTTVRRVSGALTGSMPAGDGEAKASAPALSLLEQVRALSKQDREALLQALQSEKA
jgi:integrase